MSYLVDRHSRAVHHAGHTHLLNEMNFKSKRTVKGASGWEPEEDFSSSRDDAFSEFLGNDGELLGGPVRDWFKRRKTNIQARLKVMPKWKKALLIGSGLGLLMPMTATAALTAAATVGVPTALTAVALKKTRDAAKKALAVVKARRAARAAAGMADLPADAAAEQNYTALANTETPATADHPAADAQAAKDAVQLHAAAAAENKPAALPVIPLIGLAIGALSFLKK